MKKGSLLQFLYQLQILKLCVNVSVALVKLKSPTGNFNLPFNNSQVLCALMCVHLPKESKKGRSIVMTQRCPTEA